MKAQAIVFLSVRSRSKVESVADGCQPLAVASDRAVRDVPRAINHALKAWYMVRPGYRQGRKPGTPLAWHGVVVAHCFFGPAACR